MSLDQRVVGSSPTRPTIRKSVPNARSAPRHGKELAELRLPTLVVHGEADPILPVEHGRRLASTIPGTRGIWLEGVGHAFPYPDRDDVMDSIVEHLQTAAVVEDTP